MSKISYSSLDEVWGTQLNHNNDNQPNNPIQKSVKENQHYETQIKTNKNMNINTNLNPNTKELDMYKGRAQTDYEALKEDNLKMKNIIANMNQIERTKMPENNINEDYNEYRFNPVNKVNSLYQDEKNYSPFQDDMEKKYLQDKITHLENEFRKYKMFLNNKMNGEDVIEGFANEKNEESQTDIMDLIVLIVIGLILIFIMDSIFKIGKYIGSKKSV